MGDDFSAAFEELTGHAPFPWQRALYEDWFAKGEFPSSCNLPTGLGKTNVIAVWLIALIRHPGKVPRRLVYVVNRRTVVDQTTDEVVKLRKNLPNLENLPKHFQDLAISTLRGQYADNREWSADPSRPAVICGTVDMIGSRLLFSGYGVGFKAKPLHAGFLGQDVLLVHDEAHLEPAFQDLLISIEKEQKRCNEFGAFRVLELTATSRSGGEAFPDAEEWERNKSHSVVEQRIKAKKGIKFHPVKRDDVAKTIGKMARDRKGSDKAILVFVRTIKDVKTVQQILTDKKEGVSADQVQVLTGTLRGLERDRMATADPVFARFLSEPKVSPKQDTVYLVCTSAGEVGVDISADHMVCDLTTLDSMMQRLGRVNRRGGGAAEIDVVVESDPDAKKKDDGFEKGRWKTREIMKRLPKCEWAGAGGRQEASPLELRNLNVGDDERKAAFAPPPAILPATDILFDSWALTSITAMMPGRPDVAPYLHGVADESAQTAIAWRAELDLLSNDPDSRKKLRAIFNKHQIRPHETAIVNSYYVVDFFKTISKKRPELRSTRVALIFSRFLRMTTIGDLLDNPGPLYADPTLVLPATFGGLDSNGMLSADAILADSNLDDAPILSLDVADHDGYELIPDAPARLRVLVERTDDAWRVDSLPGGRLLPESLKLESTDKTSTALFKDLAQQTGLQVRLVQSIEFNDDGDAVRSLVALAYVNARPKKEQSLAEHVKAVEEVALRIATALKLPEPFCTALLDAAKWHDEGKKAAIWQRFIGRKEGKDYKGKSAEWCDPRKLGGYRHELGSLLRLAHPHRYATVCSLSTDSDVKELALHLIAAHHGHARPHFAVLTDRDCNTSECEQTHMDVLRRFAKLQRKYGRWGVAYLESLLRAADIAASADLDAEDDDEDSSGDEA